MYRVRYLEQHSKLGERVCLSMIEEVYSRQLLLECVQQSERRAQKARRVRHFRGWRCCGWWWRCCCGAAWRKGGCGIS